MSGADSNENILSPNGDNSGQGPRPASGDLTPEQLEKFLKDLRDYFERQQHCTVSPGTPNEERFRAAFAYRLQYTPGTGFAPVQDDVAQNTPPLVVYTDGRVRVHDNAQIYHTLMGFHEAKLNSCHIPQGNSEEFIQQVLRVAEYLESQGIVIRVIYPGMQEPAQTQRGPEPAQARGGPQQRPEADAAQEQEINALRKQLRRVHEQLLQQHTANDNGAAQFNQLRQEMAEQQQATRAAAEQQATAAAEERRAAEVAHQEQIADLTKQLQVANRKTASLQRAAAKAAKGNSEVVAGLGRQIGEFKDQLGEAQRASRAADENSERAIASLNGKFDTLTAETGLRLRDAITANEVLAEALAKEKKGVPELLAILASSLAEKLEKTTELTDRTPGTVTEFKNAAREVSALLRSTDPRSLEIALERATQLAADMNAKLGPDNTFAEAANYLVKYIEIANRPAPRRDTGPEAGLAA